MADDRFYVKTLRMQNFRCFEDVELGPFDPHFNLLVGENGAGKSSVLAALTQTFQFIVAAFLRKPIEELVNYRESREPNKYIRANQRTAGAIEFLATFSWKNEERSYRAGVDSVCAYNLPADGDSGFLSSIRDESYPLLSVFTTARKFGRSILTTVDLETSRFPQRKDAFFEWNNVGQAADELVRWVRDERLIELERNGENLQSSEPNTSLGLVRNSCKEAIAAAEDFSYSGSQRDILVTFHNGQKIPFSNMSDGQRAFVGIVAEVARRMIVLNGPILGANCLAETSGLVLIDEIDLHLHPKWQRDIVPALKRIFPKIQFFATTHSPQVIGEAKPEEIVLLTPQGQKRPSGSFGMDSNWILECVMEAEGRDPEIGKRIKSLFDLIEGDRLDEAKAEIRKLREQLPAFAPDIVSAEAYIWNLEHGADEAAE